MVYIILGLIFGFLLVFFYCALKVGKESDNTPENTEELVKKD